MPAPSPALKRLPRWRTMISPPVTVWPAKTFPPRRLGFELRPVGEGPRPFVGALHAGALGVRVAAVAGGAEALLLCHYSPASLLVLPPPGPTMSVTSMRVRFWRWPVRLR